MFATIFVVHIDVGRLILADPPGIIERMFEVVEEKWFAEEPLTDDELVGVQILDSAEAAGFCPAGDILVEEAGAFRFRAADAAPAGGGAVR